MSDLPDPYPHLPQHRSEVDQPRPTGPGEIEFLMVGFRAPDGTVQLFSSRTVDQAEYEWDYFELDAWPTMCTRPFMPEARALVLTAEMQNLVITVGDTFPDALGVLHRHWAANGED